MLLNREQDQLPAWLAHRTVLEPDHVVDLGRRFPTVVFSFTRFTDLDGCSGCPEGPFDPPESSALLVYRWYGRWVEQPVAGCCIDAELESLTSRTEAVSEIEVRVLYFETKAVVA